MTVIVKRILDLLVSSVLLVLLSPLLGLIALAVGLIMRRPILFRHRRAGYRERPFTLLKFRTMTDAQDQAGYLLPDAERLTCLGKFLRQSSLDELPQLWNILMGDMSLVGPRPLLMEYLTRYSRAQRRRHQVKPGITGWAQVSGRNALTWEQKFQFDVWYVDHQSLWLDTRILFKTILWALTAQGINQPGHATAEEFRGGPR